MRYSLISLLLAMLVLAVYLAAWNEPSTLLSHWCSAVFLWALIAATIGCFRATEPRKWACRGFAATGIAMCITMSIGEPFAWSSLPFDRWRIGSAYPTRQTICNRQFAKQRQLNRHAVPWFANHNAFQKPGSQKAAFDLIDPVLETKRTVSRTSILFALASAGALGALACRQSRRTTWFLFALITVGTTTYNGLALFYSWKLTPVSAVTVTWLALATGMSLVAGWRKPQSIAALTFVMVAAAYLIWAPIEEVNYFIRIPPGDVVHRLYERLTPPQHRADVGAVFLDGSVVFVLISGNVNGVFDIEYAQSLHCFLGTFIGSAASLVVLFCASASMLWAHCRPPNRMAPVRSDVGSAGLKGSIGAAFPHGSAALRHGLGKRGPSALMKAGLRL